jgi:hypothetical protein
MLKKKPKHDPRNRAPRSRSRGNGDSAPPDFESLKIQTRCSGIRIGKDVLAGDGAGRTGHRAAEIVGKCIQIWRHSGSHRLRAIVVATTSVPFEPPLRYAASASGPTSRTNDDPGHDLQFAAVQ